MALFQVWLVKTLFSVKIVSDFMHSAWGWPTCESVHFIGLSLLIGTIATFDLRLLGFAKSVSIAALHRLVPWGVFGYLLNVTTGAMFLVTEPNQYIYNPAFQFKLLFMAIAGLNILAFYALLFGRLKRTGPGADAPAGAKVVAAVSLSVWIAVIVCGRLLTFYRPGDCDLKDAGFIATCIPHVRR
jgi:uncharacterized membrane protein